MGQSDYPFHEFALRLANVEDKYAKEIQGLVECFTNSRLDLPVKKLEDLAKARAKAARHLKKTADSKKTEGLALWKLCNVYSATAVDVDDAMRDVRGVLRKRLTANGHVKDVSAFRRFVDEYRPANRRFEPPQEIYDANKPTLKEKQRFLDMFKRDKKEEKKVPMHYAEQSYTQHLVNNAKASVRDETKQIKDPVPAEAEPASHTTIITNNTQVVVTQPIRDMNTINKKEAGNKTPVAPSRSKRTAAPMPPTTPNNSRKEKPSMPAEPSQRAPVPRAHSVAPADMSHQRKKHAKLPPTSTSTQDLSKIEVLPTMICIDTNEMSNEVTREMEKMRFSFSVPIRPKEVMKTSSERREGVLAQHHSIRITSDQGEERPKVDRSQSSANCYRPILTNGRIQRFVPESQPPRPRLQAQMITLSSSDDEISIDRL